MLFFKSLFTLVNKSKGMQSYRNAPVTKIRKVGERERERKPFIYSIMQYRFWMMSAV